MLATDYDKSTLPHLPRIIIETVPHGQQRYETCGDWYWNSNGELVVRVSETNMKYEFLVAVHEVIEAMTCNMKGVMEEEVTAFDLKFEEMRKMFPSIVGNKEPGNEDAAPYEHEHRMASQIEMWLARSLGVDEADYTNTINSLNNGK